MILVYYDKLNISYNVRIIRNGKLLLNIFDCVMSSFYMKTKRIPPRCKSKKLIHLFLLKMLSKSVKA